MTTRFGKPVSVFNSPDHDKRTRTSNEDGGRPVLAPFHGPAPSPYFSKRPSPVRVTVDASTFPAVKSPSQAAPLTS